MQSALHLPVAVVSAVLLISSVDAAALDDDNDGLSDVWQRHHSVLSNSGSNDLDGDGWDNLRESLYGTNPHLNGAPNALTDTFGLPTATTNNGFVAARWRTVRGIRYQLQRSTDLATWVNAGAPIVGTGGTATINSTGFPAATTSKLFYRLTTLPSLDTDNDGLNAFEEGLLGSSDIDSDSDNDLVPDLAEFRAHLNPTSAASNDGDTIPDDWEVFHLGNTSPLPGADPDSDDFTNLDEFTFDLDPNVNDYADGLVTHIYTYDAANRLIGVNSALSESFTYDPEGNLTNSQ